MTFYLLRIYCLRKDISDILRRGQGGLGRHGLELAQDLRRNQRRVVVIEINPDNEGISACRQAGITALIVPEESMHLLTALVAALNDSANLPALEAIPAWHEAELLPID